MSWLWFFLPDEALPLLIVGVALALIIGLLTGRAALIILGLLILIPILTPFVEALLGAMPAWIALVILVIVAIWILRGLATLFLGSSRAADHMVASVAADVVRLIVVCLFLPFRMVGWIFRTISNGRI